MESTTQEIHIPEQSPLDERISLTEVAKLAPGRPSTNCLWRWCRRGVKARDGARVRLTHLRVGGKIFTTLRWLEEFGRSLADADARYFDLSESAAAAAASREPPFPHRRRQVRQANNHSAPALREVEDAERELDEAGIR